MHLLHHHPKEKKTSHKRALLIVVTILLFNQDLYPQKEYWGIQFFAPSFHLSEDTLELGDHYSYKLDHKGKVVALPGVKWSYDWQPTQGFFVGPRWQINAAFYKDCMQQNSFAIQFGPKWAVFEFNESNYFLIGLAPAFWARKSWQRFEQYKPDGTLSTNDEFLPGYEYLFVPSLDFQIDIKIGKQRFLSWTIVPAIPFFLAQSVGLRWKL